MKKYFSLIIFYFIIYDSVYASSTECSGPITSWSGYQLNVCFYTTTTSSQYTGTQFLTYSNIQCTGTPTTSSIPATVCNAGTNSYYYNPSSGSSNGSSISQISQEIAVVIAGCVLFVLCAIIVSIVVYGDYIKSRLG